MPDDLGSGTLLRWVAAIDRADRAGWPLVMLIAADPADPLDGLAMAAWCAASTTHIRLCASIDGDTVEPFTLARGLATLDHLSGGRAAWRLTGSDATGRVTELADVVSRLLLSWGAEALIENVAAAMLSDAEAVMPIAHDGAHFSLRGPLNIPRPPQGVPLRLALPGDPAQAGAVIVEPDGARKMSIGLVSELFA